MPNYYCKGVTALVSIVVLVLQILMLEMYILSTAKASGVIQVFKIKQIHIFYVVFWKGVKYN